MEKVELWRSISGKLHLPGEGNRSRCGLLSEKWEKATGTIADITCGRCKDIAYEPILQMASEEVKEKLQQPDPDPELETAAAKDIWNPVFRFEANEEGPRLCWCGCGQPVKGKKARFVPGHDARLYAMIRKIEEGTVDEDIIPEELRQRMARCTCCGKPILPHPSGMGPLCRSGKCRCKAEV